MKILILFVLLFNITAEAKANKKLTPPEVSTDHSFNDATVRGRYHTSGEAIATVEDEKVLNNILSVRTNFKDRVKKSFLEQ